jgi:hypothetical protein
MPTVLQVGPYRFYFFSNKGNEPPHIHVKSGKDVAKFWISSIELASNHGFRAQELNKIEQIIEEHLIELLEAWNEYLNRK